MSAPRPIRVTWVDQAKGFGISLVVLGHVLRGLHSGRVIGGGATFSLVDSWIYAFHMPLFFALSGLFSPRRADRPPRDFFRGLAATVAYPYVIWSVTQALIQWAAGDYTNGPARLGDLGSILVAPLMQFWFLYVLFFVATAHYALRRLGLGEAGALLVFVGFWATRWFLPLDGTGQLPSVRDFAPFFAAGATFNRGGAIGRVSLAPAWVLAATASAGFGVVTVAACRPGSGPPAGVAAAACGVVASAALAVLLERTRAASAVGALGSYSLEIYAAHTIASAGIRIALRQLLHIGDPATHVVLGTVGGLVLPLALGVYSRRHAAFLFKMPSFNPPTWLEKARARRAVEA